MHSMTATKSFTVDTNILIYSIDRSDLHDGRPYGSLTVRNPFKLSETELDALLD